MRRVGKKKLLAFLALCGELIEKQTVLDDDLRLGVAPSLQLQLLFLEEVFAVL